MTTLTTNDPALDRALDWLHDAQLPSGELVSVAAALDQGPPVWVPDSLKFITALGALALDELPDDRAATVVDRAVAFLRYEQETMAQWRYWAEGHPQYDLTPPDADDTACCSMAVATRGHSTARNRAVLLANRDRAGRFYTWLVPHRPTADPRRWWAMRDEWRSTVRARRRDLWETTEARPDDVDGVVNANVVRYLGHRAPRRAVEWVRSLVLDGQEADCDSWHRNPFTLYAGLADGHRRGVAAFADLAPLVVERARERLQSVDAPPLDLASALLALDHFGAPGREVRRLVDELRDRQLHDGSWKRSVFYHGGPREVFGWASEALTTATAAQALHRCGAGAHRG